MNVCRLKEAALLAALLVVFSDSATSEELPELNWRNFESILERVVPQEEELRYENIEWRETLSLAIAEAAEVGKPVLVWAMNGDPCGFT
ncbi:MAG: hypothetical protein AAF236_02820 [Verrucomicrobiota bacterium]